MRVLKNFVAGKSGNVAVLFGLSLLPIMILTGAAIDFGRISTAHTNLQSVVDAATLDTAIYLTQAVAQGSHPNASQVRKQFQRMLAARTSTTGQFSVQSSSVTFTDAPSQVTVTAAAQATVIPTFGKFFGKASYGIAADSTAAKDLAIFANISLVLDVSPSMAIAATAGDIATLKSVTINPKDPSGCAFACHDPQTGSTGPDYYSIARANNVTLRIDVVKSAAQQLANYIPTAQSTPNQYSMGLYTMSWQLGTVVAPTTSLSDVAAAVPSIDFDKMSSVVAGAAFPPQQKVYAADHQDPAKYADSDFAATLTSLNNTVASVGDGTQTTSRKQFVFLVTDGVNDVGVPYNAAVSPTYSYPAAQNYAATGNAYSKLTSPIDAAWCDQLKNRGVQVAVLYVTYVPSPTEGLWQDLVQYNAPQNSISDKLTACASSGQFYVASDSTQIATGLKAAFDTINRSVRLTN